MTSAGHCSFRLTTFTIHARFAITLLLLQLVTGYWRSTFFDFASLLALLDFMSDTICCTKTHRVHQHDATGSKIVNDGRYLRLFTGPFGTPRRQLSPILWLHSGPITYFSTPNSTATSPFPLLNPNLDLLWMLISVLIRLCLSPFDFAKYYIIARLNSSVVNTKLQRSKNVLLPRRTRPGIGQYSALQGLIISNLVYLG